MSVSHLDLDLVFQGPVLDLRVELEGSRIGGWVSDGDSTWKRKLRNFPVDGPLDVYMRCRGFNDLDWEFSISSGERQLLAETGTIEKGFSKISESIDLVQFISNNTSE